MKNSKSLLVVKFNSGHSAAELIQLFEQDIDLFEAVPGLIQKYYIFEEATGAHGGVYIFKNEAAKDAYLSSELAAKVPAMYGVKADTLRVEQFIVSIEMTTAVNA